MSIEDHVLALIEEGNPVPDPEQITDAPVEPAAYLATLQERSSEVTQLDERTTTGESTQNRWWIAAAAVLIAVLGAVVFVLAQGGDEVPPATEPPTTTTPGADPQALIGTWSSGVVTAVFQQDSYAFIIDDVLVERGTYTTEADPASILYTSADDSPGCEAGAEGRVFFETGASSVTISPNDDSCFFRAVLFAGTGGLSSVEPIDPESLPTELDIQGSWGSEEAGAVFESGQYSFVIDGELVDQGSYELATGPYQIELTSGSTDPDCATGSYGLALNSGEVLLLEPVDGEDACSARAPIAFRDLAPVEAIEIPER